jgi:CubicO group peptidase (beta-lactamase class C family)
MPMDPLYLLTRLPAPFLARCRVPWHLEEVRTIAEELPGREVGVSQGALERIWEQAEALYRTGVHPALQLCIRHRGEIVLHRALGHARGNAPHDPPDAEKPLCTTQTPLCIFSASKAVAAMVIHKLDEKRVLHLEDRVCEFIPRFARHGKDRITLRHILAHRAGIPNIPPEAMDLNLLADPEQVIDILCNAKPRSRPGRLLAYHAVSGGFVFAEVVRRVTGQDIRTILAKEILEPLGLRWMNFGVKPQDVDRVAVNAFTGPPVPPPLSTLLRRALGTSLKEVVDISNDPRFVTGIVPSANVMTTADEFSAFFQCLMNGGELGGVRVFDPRTIAHATGEQSCWEIDFTLAFPIRYGLGFMLGDRVSMFGVDNPEAFGHLGLSNVVGWADPERKLSVGLITSGKPIMSAHVARVVQLILEIGRAFPSPRA